MEPLYCINLTLGGSAFPKHNFLCAEVEQKWKLKAQNEEAALSQARLEVEVANERVNAAEMAKIQLSMRLAELDDLKAQMNSSREPELTVSVNAQEQLEDKVAITHCPFNALDWYCKYPILKGLAATDSHFA